MSDRAVPSGMSGRAGSGRAISGWSSTGHAIQRVLSAGVRRIRSNAYSALRLSLEIRSYRLHFLQAQVLSDTVHDGDVAQVALERGELLQHVLSMLAGQSREVGGSVSIRTVARRAGWNTF